MLDALGMVLNILYYRKNIEENVPPPKEKSDEQEVDLGH